MPETLALPFTSPQAGGSDAAGSTTALFPSSQSYPMHREASHRPPRCRLARTAGEVDEAWSLVRRVYAAAGFVSPGADQRHLTSEVFSARSAVVLNRWGGRLRGTLTVIVEDGQGLPLDAVVPEAMRDLRDADRRLLEIGLFAEDRTADRGAGSTSEGAGGLLAMFGLAFAYGRAIGVTDFVIGVHPRRASLYGRAFGFEPIAEPTCYRRLRDQPVLPMRADLPAVLAAPRPHPGIARFLRHPPPIGFWRDRLRLDRIDRRASAGAATRN